MGGKAVHGRTASGIRGEVTQGETGCFVHSDRAYTELALSPPKGLPQGPAPGESGEEKKNA